MPTDLHFKSRTASVATATDKVLGVSCRCLIAVAVSLAILLFVKLEIVSWIGEGHGVLSSHLEMMVTSP